MNYPSVQMFKGLLDDNISVVIYATDDGTGEILREWNVWDLYDILPYSEACEVEDAEVYEIFHTPDSLILNISAWELSFLDVGED